MLSYVLPGALFKEAVARREDEPGNYFASRICEPDRTIVLWISTIGDNLMLRISCYDDELHFSGSVATTQGRD